MSRRWQLAIGGIVVAIILLIAGVPLWVPLVLFVAALAAPVVGYMKHKPAWHRARVRKYCAEKGWEVSVVHEIERKRE